MKPDLDFYESLRQANIKREARRLCGKGEEFYPWTAENLGEAFANFSDAALKRIVQLHETGEHGASFATISSAVKQYWLTQAIYRANLTCASAHELAGK